MRTDELCPELTRRLGHNVCRLKLNFLRNRGSPIASFCGIEAPEVNRNTRPHPSI